MRSPCSTPPASSAAHVMGASMGGAIAQLVAAAASRAGPVAGPRLHGVRNHLWRRELLSEWAAIANERGMGEMAKRAAHWVMAPARSGGSGPPSAGSVPLAMGLPAHAFASQVRAILDAPEQMADVLADDRRADAGRGGQPGHPDAAGRQRGAGRAHPGRRAGRDLGRGTRPDD